MTVARHKRRKEQTWQQLLLAFPLAADTTFATLVVGEHNATAVAGVRQVMALPATGLTIVGEAGCGKSHLLQAAVRQQRLAEGEESAGYWDLAALGARLGDVAAGTREEVLATFLERHEGCRLVAVDQLEGLEGHPLLQEGVLFLYNTLKRNGGRLLAAGRHPPQELPGLRDDLRSRLLWGPVLTIGPPGEEELTAILRKLAADRQVRVGDELIGFLVRRLPRRVPDCLAVLERLDREALRQQRPLTIPLAKEVLGL